MPANITGNPQIAATSATSAQYTLEMAKIEKVLQLSGQGTLVLPPELDGATITLDWPASVLLAYGSDPNNPQLVIGQMQQPTLTVPGEVNVKAVRLALLSAPGLPPELQRVARQIEALQDWRNTVPVPVPPEATATEVTVAGAKGLILSHTSKNEHAIIWSDRGWLYGVASHGGLSADDLLRIAGSLR